MSIDFLAIGDTVVDDFIRLKDAEVHCDVSNEKCTICMRFGDKIPFESSTKVYGVGNAANAAVAAARLGLTTAFVSDVGRDRAGDEVVDTLKKEGIKTRFIARHKDIPTNYHYVLWYGDERSILVKHEAYPYVLPTGLPEPKTVYLSSLAGGTEQYHEAIADWLEAHPKIFFAFQPGTFQMKLGVEKLGRLYQRADIFFANKEEYQRILNSAEENEETLLKKMYDLGPKIPILTDGRNGVYALENGAAIHLDMYPDPKPPLQRTGAGDAFSSTTAAYLTMGYSLRDSMQRGLVNSAYVVQKVGAQAGLLTKKELESKLT